ncbi:hypothetical protein CO671_01820 [Rhizobium sp. M10]|uniref:hypothetical protein n=1 Tax=Rhizobium sp. M10 TaxID=1324586 RepID=UPI000BE9596D|nr:hypothetical protein [Rhizobium sp. M10]PDT38160.1 hypothetical protein CO671_01820 [Rhizobium sp. M10]
MIFDTQKLPKAQAGRRFLPFCHGTDSAPDSTFRGHFSMQNAIKQNPSVFKAAVTTAFALFLASCSGSPGIEGKYTDPNGNTVDLLKDGTAIFVVKGTQAVWKWTTYDDNRLKLEPGPGIPGSPPAAVCNYQLDGSKLRVAGCDYAMQLTRM